MQTRYRVALDGLFFMALLAMVTGCGDGTQAAGAQPSVARQTTPAVTPAPELKPAPATPAPATGASVAAPAPSEAWLLNLDGEGLRYFNGSSGASRLIAFGDDSRQSAETLGRVLGETEPVSVENEECQLGFARWSNGLTVWSDSSHFVGWSLARHSPPLATAAGVKLGSSRAELEAAYQAEIFESSLGTEFSAGGLAGLLDSARADARISNLWAGQTCIAR